MGNPPGSFIWYELMTTDADAAGAFYGAIIGWDVVKDPAPDPAGPDYRHIIRSDGGANGGVLQLTAQMCDAGAHPCWLPYLYVTDIDAAVASIGKDGGQVMMPPTDIGVGVIAMLTDPQGVPIYVMTPRAPADNPDATSDVFSPTAPQRVAWNELASPDLAGSKAFYARHFGFAFNEAMPMGDLGEYCFIDHGGQRLGAMMQRPDPAAPAGWLPYFRVPAIADAKAGVEAGGGAVLMGPHEVPSGEWIIVGRDPQGAAFGLVSTQGI